MGPAADDIDGRLPGSGLHRVSLPAANEMGRVNAWVVDDEPLTLVDGGSRTPEGLERLEAALGALGRRVEDVGLVLVTHQHTDHLGLVADVAERSGAEVAAPAPVGPYLEELERETALDRAFMADVLRRHGAAPQVVAANDAGWATFHRTARPCRVGLPLAPGSRLTLRDRTLEVLARPGHSETDVLLVDAERRLAITGDHLLRSTPSVPMRDRPLPAGDGSRPYRPLVDDIAVLNRYRESLRATRELAIDLALPGHGAPFADPAAVVDAHLARQEREAADLLERIGTAPAPAFALVAELWPGYSPALAIVLLSAVLGRLGMLVHDGAVEVLPDARGARYRAC